MLCYDMNLFIVELWLITFAMEPLMTCFSAVALLTVPLRPWRTRSEVLIGSEGGSLKGLSVEGGPTVPLADRSDPFRRSVLGTIESGTNMSTSVSRNRGGCGGRGGENI